MVIEIEEKDRTPKHQKSRFKSEIQIENKQLKITIIYAWRNNMYISIQYLLQTKNN